MANNKFIRNIKIEADEQGNIPKVLDLLHEGSWNTPWHGDFETTRADIYEYVEHFNQKIGLPEDNDGEAPVNYSHKGDEKAGGWMKKLRAEEFADGRLHLVADFEPTPAGAKAIKDKEFKYLSPEFNPRALPWEDPEEEWRFVSNVITGAALTNIPLFKKLKKVAASERPSEPEGSSSKPKKGERMTFKLEDLRGKEASQISADERAFLEENKAELTADELRSLDIKADEQPQKPATKVEGDTKDQVTISASELAELKASASRGVEAAQKLEQKEASDFADARIAAGQVKSDEKDKLTSILLASSGDQRAAIEAFVAGLPENERLKEGSQELGDGGSDAKSAGQKLDEAARAIVKASAEAGSEKSYGDALVQARRENKELADEADQEVRG